MQVSGLASDHPLPRSSLVLRHCWLLLIPVLLLSTWFGARRLNTDGIWYDEWWSLYTSGATYFGPPLSPVGVWNRIATEDPLNPPGYFMLLSLWGRAVGWTEAAARALSLLTGLLAVACTYQLGRTLSRDALVGLGAAVALGASVWFIHYLHEIRGYALYVLLSALFLICYFRLCDWRKQPNTKPYPAALYFGFVVSGAALLYVHYFGALLFVVVGFWHLIHFRQSRHWWLVLACILAAGLLYIPWINNALPALGMRGRVNQVDTNISQLGGEIIYVFSNASIALFALLALVGLRVRRARMIWMLALLLFVLNLAAMRLLKLNELRYVLDLLPLLAVLVGLGVRALASALPTVGPGLILVVWIVSAIVADGDQAVLDVIRRFPTEPVREMAQTVGPYLRKSDVVINILGQGLRSTIQQSPLMFYLGNLPGRKEILERVFLPSVPAFVDRVHQAVGDAQHVWVLYSPHWPSTEWSLFLNILDQSKFQPCITLSDTDTMRIIGFAKVDDVPPSLTFGSGIRIRLIEATSVRDGALVTWLEFAIDPTVPPDTYSFGVHLEDANGILRGQWDAGLPGTGHGCRLARIDVAQLPPGPYQLKLVIYDWRTSQRLSGIATDGSHGDSLLLTQITK